MTARTALDLETPQPGTLVIRLARPERLNAINEVLLRELEDVLDATGADDHVRVVVLTGAGRGFCAGLDLRDFGSGIHDATASTLGAFRFQERMGSLPVRLRDLPQPVVAAVNGPAVGGGLALGLGADLRICSASASFGNAAIRLGLSGAEMGMSYHLPRIVGTTVAAEWMLTGRTVSADEAFRCGLVSEVVDDERLMGRALELAAMIAEHSPIAVRLTKRALQVNTDAPDLRAALEMENRNQVITAASGDFGSAHARWSRP